MTISHELRAHGCKITACTRVRALHQSACHNVQYCVYGVLITNSAVKLSQFRWSLAQSHGRDIPLAGHKSEFNDRPQPVLIFPNNVLGHERVAGANRDVSNPGRFVPLLKCVVTFIICFVALYFCVKV